MSAINTLKGQFIKDYKITHKEKLSNGLWFYVILRYNSNYNSKDFYRSSSEIYIDAIITDGILNSYGNNVVSYREIEKSEDIKKPESFTSLLPEVVTKDGYKVWQEEYNKREYSMELEDKKFEKRKARNTKWLITVPKEDLLKFCLNKL